MVSLPWSLSPLPWLAIGVLSMLARGVLARTSARVALLCIYPVALVSVTASVSQATLEHVHTPWSLLLCALVLLAYLAGAAAGCADPRPAPSPASPVPGLVPERRESGRELARRALAGVWLGAALVLVIVAPLQPGFDVLQHEWGDSAASGAVLAAVLATALATTSVGVFLSSLLRASDAEPLLRPSALRVRVITLLASAALSAAAYAILVR